MLYPPSGPRLSSLTRIQLLEYRVDREGEQLTAEKIVAISEPLSLKYLVELHSYLKLLIYYSHFIANLSILLQSSKNCHNSAFVENVNLVLACDDLRTELGGGGVISVDFIRDG